MTPENAPAYSPIDETTEIVSAYVSNNSVTAADLPALISSVYAAIVATSSPAKVEPAPLVPAVPVKKSVSDDYIVCLEDGKKFKSLKRHLMTHYNLTPEAYRAKWSLPIDYPMVASNYAATRSALAKTMGLGRKPGPLAVSGATKAAKARASKKVAEAAE